MTDKLKCCVCNKDAEENSIVCGDGCQQVRLQMLAMGNKYAKTNGCENCLGDLHSGCSQTCKDEFKKSGQFYKDCWTLIRLCFKEAL